MHEFGQKNCNAFDEEENTTGILLWVYTLMYSVIF